MYSYKTSVNGKEKEKLLSDNFLNFHLMFECEIHDKNIKFVNFTINVRKSRRQPQCTLQLVWCIDIYYVNFNLYPTPQTKI